MTGARGPAGPAATTRLGTVRHGAERSGGWRELAIGPAEAPAAEPGLDELGGGNLSGLTPLATIAHLSDLHICDAESPVRLEYLDHLADPGMPYADIFEEIGTYRPQEILTAQVATAMVHRLNEFTVGPLVGRPIDTVLVTGDVVDNAQANELNTYLSILDGGEVTPRSGDPSRSSWVGAATAGFYSDRFWHPDGPDAGQPLDRQLDSFGYPLIPGLAEAARRGFTSPGLKHRWLTVHGNHDALLQGTVAGSECTRRQAIGDRRVIDLAPDQTAYAALEATPAVGPARYVDTNESPRVTIAADPSRRLLVAGDLPAAHAALGEDHGWLAGDEAGYWVRDLGGIRLIALDTVNPHGGWEGSLDRTQFEWLRTQLAETDRPTVITSHHPSWTLRNPWTRDNEPRVLAEELIRLLLAQPRVLLWIAGHVHANTARLHPSPAGGLLELTTASLIDWPQQGRMLELLDDGSGGMVVASTVIDHPGWWAPELARPEDSAAAQAKTAQAITEELADPMALAGLSRLLAANDYRARRHPVGLEFMAGAAQARNTVWHIRRSGLSG